MDYDSRRTGDRFLDTGSTPVYSMATNRIKWGFLKCRVIFRVIYGIIGSNLIQGAQRRKEGPIYKQIGHSLLNGRCVATTCSKGERVRRSLLLSPADVSQPYRNNNPS